MLSWFINHPIMKALRSPTSDALGKLALRFVLGAIFINHGYPKLVGASAAGAVKFFTSIGIPSPEFFAPFVGVVEFFGGILIILGLFTRFWAAGLVIDMFVAMAAAKKFASWNVVEYELILLAAALLLFLSGAGRWSIDAVFMKKYQK